MALSPTQNEYLVWLHNYLVDQKIGVAGKWRYANNLISNGLQDKSSEKLLRNESVLRVIRQSAYEKLKPEEVYFLRIVFSLKQAAPTPLHDQHQDPRYAPNPAAQQSETHIQVNTDSIQYRGTGGFKAITEMPSQTFSELVLEHLLEHKDILDKGLSPISWDVLENRKKGDGFTREQVQQVLRCFRALIDCYKLKELPYQYPDFISRGFATFLGYYVDTMPKMFFVKVPGFRINTTTYIMDQIKDPESDNSFLLQLNMLFG